MTDTSKQRFRAGQRVRMTAEALRCGLAGRRRADSGTVTSRPRRPEFVTVRVDGNKTASVFSAAFWEPIE